MKRKAAALLMGLLFFLAACGGQKPKPPGENGWQEGPIALTAAPELDLGTCAGVSGAKTQEWDADSGLPDRPEDTLILLAAGHGPNGKRPPYATCYDTNGNEQPLPTVAGKNEIQEDELTMALTLRLEAVLKRLGFPVELIRYGDYGTEGDCAQKALFRKSPLVHSANSNALFCDWRYLSVRGRSDVYKLSSIKRLCANDPACINDVHIPGTKHAISRAGQLVRDHAARLGITYDPAGENSVNSPKVAYISIHFNSVAAAGDEVGTMLAMFSGTVRHQKSGYRPNPALTFQGPNHEPLGSVAKNYATSVFEYMFHSLRESGALPEARGKRVLVYQNVDLVNQSHRAQPATPYTFESDGREGPLNDPGNPVRFNVNPPNPRVTGPVTVVSGLDSFYSNAPKKSYRALPEIISISNNITIEVAHYRDCRNAVPLLQSLQRPITNPDFDADTSPLNTNDPLDVAAADIAHGLVEYYESYVPGFKQQACDNLKNSDWKDHLPDWCSGGGGGGGEARVPDIHDVTPASIELSGWVNAPSAPSESVVVAFSNAGTADLEATVSTSSPVADVGPPNVYPAGTAAPLSGSQHVALAPGERAHVEVSASCSEEGDFTSEVTIRSNDPDEPEVVIPMTVHCRSGPTIYIVDYDVARRTFYTSDDDGNRFYIPEYTAVNYWLDADAGWETLADPTPSFGIFTWGGGSETPLEFWFETPSWLELVPDSGELYEGDYLPLDALEARGHCDGAEEKNGFIVIHSNDPTQPEVGIPVRLMCGYLQVELDPTTYNRLDDPPSELCRSFRARVTVQGADHLQELYLNVVTEDGPDGSTPVGVEYLLPSTGYTIADEDGWSARRWGELSAYWSWDDFPVLNVYSWTNTCVYEPGTYRIENFWLYPFVLDEAGSIFIENNQFPGIVYNVAEMCDDNGENCVPMQARHRIEDEGRPTHELELDFDEWKWSAHTFTQGFDYFVEHLINDAVVETNERHVPAFFDPYRIRYCSSFAKLGKDSLHSWDGSTITLPDMPHNVFWGQVIDYISEDRYSVVVETAAGAWCYDPPPRDGSGTAASESPDIHALMKDPWNGARPHWVPGDELFCLSGCEGYRLWKEGSGDR